MTDKSPRVPPGRAIENLWFRVLAASLLILAGSELVIPSRAAEPASPTATYADQVRADRPVLYVTFDAATRPQIAVYQDPASQRPALTAALVGAGELGVPGPRSPLFPRFSPTNDSLELLGLRGYVRIVDPGAGSNLDFGNGDSVTLEAWVSPTEIPPDQQVYIVGKGRTHNAGQMADNQNFALRLRGVNGSARLSFLFRSLTGSADGKAAYHRWNSTTGFSVDSGWHHVAVSYSFGQSDSIRGYIDGRSVDGSWDYAGPTREPPVVDDDELWIGSSQGGQAASTFSGGLDEVAIYRRVLDPERIASRFARAPGPDPFSVAVTPEAPLPVDGVRIEWYEGLSERSWNLQRARPMTSQVEPAMAILHVPGRFDDHGNRADWRLPILARGWASRELPAGDYELLIRSRNAARLYVDGQLRAQTRFLDGNGDGHELVPDVGPDARADEHPLPPAHQEVRQRVSLTAGPHEFRFEAIVGGRRFRPEPGELVVALAAPGQTPILLTATQGTPVPLTEASWLGYVAEARRRAEDSDARRRRTAAASDAAHWSRRHDYARRLVAALPAIVVPPAVDGYPAYNDIDRFLARHLAKAGVPAPPLVDDYQFIRRAALDTVGVIPSRALVAEFLGETSRSSTGGPLPAAMADQQQRRTALVDRLLAEPGWADHWVGYWQDVLGENPGILKPEQNNTGPFRWWLHDVLADNWPLDRWVTELLMMRGSQYYGGPAGFAMASQNDAPMAAKAQIGLQAFLGLELKCARCHDAPYHPFTQQQLFGLAAMLGRQPITLPKSSTVGSREGGREPLVTASLKPGDTIHPEWKLEGWDANLAPAALLLDPADSRERLAAIVTAPSNARFAQVAVNRVWKRLMGWGLVDPVDDWEAAKPVDADLLDWLARELVTHDYDLKHVARLIMNSHTYQRQAIARTLPARFEAPEWWAAPLRRRLSAEQLVDSAYVVAGKAFDTEPLTMDPEGRRPVDTFLNLGTPRRAWEFTSLSNERDRPALALPRAQQVVDLLLAFGWRDARPNGLTQRDESATFLQPLTLANGVAATRLTRLSDDNRLTQLALEDRSVHDFVDQLFLQILSRPPRSTEREAFVTVLEPGFAERRIVGVGPAPVRPKPRHAVSWANHLNAEATRIKQQLERDAQRGDPPTAMLRDTWRERAEDAAWALLNSPEFVFVP